jgi:hypothetical protein
MVKIHAGVQIKLVLLYTLHLYDLLQFLNNQLNARDL